MPSCITYTVVKLEFTWARKENRYAPLWGDRKKNHPNYNQNNELRTIFLWWGKHGYFQTVAWGNKTTKSLWLNPCTNIDTAIPRVMFDLLKLNSNQGKVKMISTKITGDIYVYPSGFQEGIQCDSVEDLSICKLHKMKSQHKFVKKRKKQ